MIRLPDFLIIGAPRSGTTYLSAQLQKHPEVYLARIGEIYSTGDIHFFDVSRAEGKANYAKGFKWYADLFSQAHDKELIGEKTADYLADPNAPELIRKYLGQRIKLIVLLRNPIERAYSHYWHERSNLPVVMNFGKAIRTADLGQIRLLDSGFYYRNLMRYIEHFDSGQIHIILSDDLFKDPGSALEKLFIFLGITSDVQVNGLKDVINPNVTSGGVYHLSLLAGILKRYAPWLFSTFRSMPGIDLLKKQVAQARGLQGTKGNKPQSYPPIKKEDWNYLSNIYHDDIVSMGKWINRDLVKLWLK